MKKNLWIISLILSFTSGAWANGYFRLSGMYIKDSSGYEGSNNSTSRTMIDFGAGYVNPSGWTIGGLYGTEKISSPNSSVDRSGFGPTVGWVNPREQGAFILGTYFLNLKEEQMTGQGYQIDLGYKFPIGSISFAPQLSFKKFTYDKSSGNTMDPKFIEDKIDPYFVLWFDF